MKKKIIKKIILIILQNFNNVFQTLSKNTKFLVNQLSTYNQVSTSELTKFVGKAQIKVLRDFLIFSFKAVFTILSNSKLFFKNRVNAIFLYCSSIFENRKPSIKNLKFVIIFIKFIIKLLFFCLSPVGSSPLLLDIFDFSFSPTPGDTSNSFLKPKIMSSLKIIFNFLTKKRKNNSQTNENTQNSSEFENNNLYSNSSSHAESVKETAKSIGSSNLEHSLFSTSEEVKAVIKKISKEKLNFEGKSLFLGTEVDGDDPFKDFYFSASSGFEGHNRKKLFKGLNKLPSILEESDT